MATLLKAPSLLRYISSCLPKDTSTDIQSSTQGVAIVCHACFLAVGFRLVGLSEADTLESSPEATGIVPLPHNWSTSAPSFRYKHHQSSMEYMLKVDRLGSKTLIYGIGKGDDKVVTFDITTSDFVSPSAFPFKRSDVDPEDSVVSVFISRNRLEDLGSLVKANILQKLIPGLQKEGYEENVANSEATSQRQDTSTRPESLRAPINDPLRADPRLPPSVGPHPLADPLAVPRRQGPPFADFPPPDFEDEFEMHRSTRHTGLVPSRTPGYGESDLYPPGLGPHDPLRIGGVGPGIRDGGYGGMHPTFDDPMFGPRSSLLPNYDGQTPPGARYDPPGPGTGPPQGSHGRGFGGPRAPPNPFSGYGSGDFI